MPDLPPTTAKRPTDPDEPDRTGRHDGTPTPALFSIEPGTVIAGKYKLLEQLGEGGMGAVWMAQQTDPVKRLVAVKLIKAGTDARSRPPMAARRSANMAEFRDCGRGRM
jgi:serine/threonine protein kinase